MPGKRALVQFDDCRPACCRDGVCQAMLACKHKLIKQEKPAEIPLFSPSSCQGCGDCVRACPRQAVKIYPA
jgi:translation initiation factor RLI1